MTHPTSEYLCKMIGSMRMMFVAKRIYYTPTESLDVAWDKAISRLDEMEINTIVLRVGIGLFLSSIVISLVHFAYCWYIGRCTIVIKYSRV